MAETVPANDPASTLASGISAGASSLTVATGDGTGKGFSDPAGSNVGRLVLVRASDQKKEIVSFTDRSGDSFTGLTRAVEPVRGDQTAYAFVTGDAVYEVLTNASLTELLSAALSPHDHTSSTTDGGTLTNDTHDGYSEYAEIAAPSSPAANKGRLYGKDSGALTKPFWKDEGGTEYDLSDTTHVAAADPHTGYVLESLLDAKGDLIAASADNTPAKVGVGTNGQYLKADSGASAGVSWADLPTGAGVRAYHSTDQNVNDSTETALAFDSERRDDNAEHTTGGSNTRLTAAGAGWRLIFGTATFDTPILAGTVRRLSIRLNGTTVIASDEERGIVNTGPARIVVAGLYYLAAADYVELMAFQDSGATLAVKANANYSAEFGMANAGAASVLTDHDHTTTGDGGTLTNDTHDGYADFAEISAPSSPSANHGRLYGKDASGITLPFWKDEGGAERILGQPIAYLSDEKAQGTDAGTFTSGAWRTRTITEKSDPDGIVAVSSSQFTPVAGTYDFDAFCPAWEVNRHQARLQNVTAATTTLVGSSEFSGPNAGASTQSSSRIHGTFTANGTDAYEIQHQCQTTRAAAGLGLDANFGTEVYTRARLQRIA